MRLVKARWLSVSKESKNNEFKKAFVTVKYFYKVIWKNFKSYIVFNLIAAVMRAVYPLFIVFLPKILIDEFQASRDFKRMLYIALAFVVGYIAVMALDSICTQTYQKKVDEFNRYFEMQHKQKCAEMDFDLTEDPKILDLASKAQTGLRWYGGVDAFMSSFTGIISGVLSIISTGFILFTGSIWIVLLAVTVLILNFFITKKSNSIEKKQNEDTAILDRKLNYNFWQVSDFKYGKDVRLYDASDMLIDNCNEVADEFIDVIRVGNNKMFALSGLSSVITTVNNIGMYGILGAMAIKKTITIGNFTMYASAATQFTNSMMSIIQSAQHFFMVSTYLYNYVDFMGIKTDSAFGNAPIDEAESHVIEFKDVWFKYPRTENYILQGVNITIKSGEKLSIVGLNGAGKTTFIKLLCRLYKVDKGEILIDGKNINSYDFNEYSKLFSVVFQDFKLFSFSIKENIALSEKPDTEKVKKLCEQVGLGKKISSLPNGIDTVLFRQFDDSGIEPSGGEQQKMSIARALYKDSSIVILDEPTAALDPVAEYDIYRQFNDFVERKTAIYISHRLSSCKFCDKIAVFSGNNIAEYGTHDELLKIKNGIYSKMWNAQAQYYA